jgi:hypothetical protein
MREPATTTVKQEHCDQRNRKSNCTQELGYSHLAEAYARAACHEIAVMVITRRQFRVWSGRHVSRRDQAIAPIDQVVSANAIYQQ